MRNEALQAGFALDEVREAVNALDLDRAVVAARSALDTADADRDVARVLNLLATALATGGSLSSDSRRDPPQDADGARRATVASMDASVAQGIELISGHLSRSTDVAPGPVMAALARAMRIPSLMPDARLAAEALVTRLEADDAPVRDLPQVRALARLLMVLEAGGEVPEELAPDSAIWSDFARRLCIDLLLRFARRARDNRALLRLGTAVTELVRRGDVNDDRLVERLIRELRVTATNIFEQFGRGSEAGRDLIAAERALYDALRGAVPEVADRLAMNLDRWPVDAERRRFIRGLWDSLIDNFDERPLGRIVEEARGRFGDLSSHERELLQVRTLLLEPPSREGCRTVLAFLEREIAAALFDSRIDRLPWLRAPDGAPFRGVARGNATFRLPFAVMLWRVFGRSADVAERSKDEELLARAEAVIRSVATLADLNSISAEFLDIEDELRRDVAIMSARVHRLLLDGELDSAYREWASTVESVKGELLLEAFEDELARRTAEFDEGILAARDGDVVIAARFLEVHSLPHEAITGVLAEREDRLAALAAAVGLGPSEAANRWAAVEADVRLGMKVRSAILGARLAEGVVGRLEALVGHPLQGRTPPSSSSVLDDLNSTPADVTAIGSGGLRDGVSRLLLLEHLPQVAPSLLATDAPARPSDALLESADGLGLRVPELERQIATLVEAAEGFVASRSVATPTGDHTEVAPALDDRPAADERGDHEASPLTITEAPDSVPSERVEAQLTRLGRNLEWRPFSVNQLHHGRPGAAGRASAINRLTREVANSLREVVTAYTAAGDLDEAANLYFEASFAFAPVSRRQFTGYYYMPLVDAICRSANPSAAGAFIERVIEAGGRVDSAVLTMVINALGRAVAECAPSEELEIAKLVAAADSIVSSIPSDVHLDDRYFAAMVRMHAMAGRVERCEELVVEAEAAGCRNDFVNQELVRAYARAGRLSALERVIQTIRRRGDDAAGAALAALVATRSLVAEGHLDMALEWTDRIAPAIVSHKDAFTAVIAGFGLSLWHAAYRGRGATVESFVRIVRELRARPEYVSWMLATALMRAGTGIAISGDVGERWIVAHTILGLLHDEALTTASIDSAGAEALCWAAKHTGSRELARVARERIHVAGIPWTAGLVGRLLEVEAKHGQVDDARALFRMAVETIDLTTQERTYLYNVFLSALRSPQRSEERETILVEMEHLGLELDRFGRAELGLAMAQAGAFSDDGRMLRSDTATRWRELIEPLKDGAERFEPLAARLQMEIRMLLRAAERSPTELGELQTKAKRIDGVRRELGEQQRAFQAAMAVDAAGEYSAQRYAITSDIVHELSQPVATIALQQRQLDKSLSAGDLVTARARLSEMSASSSRLGARLRSYRESIVEATSATVDEQDFILHDAFQRAWRGLEADFVKDVRVVGAESLRRDERTGVMLSIRGNSYLMQRAFHALLTNAIEAMRRAEVNEPTIEVSAFHYPSQMLGGAESGTIQLFISDNGPGIPEAIRNEIFSAGFTTRNSRGLGLGLATVASIVEAHAGIIQLVDPKTARFIMVFPAADSGESVTVRGGLDTDADSPGELAASGEDSDGQAEGEDDLEDDVRDTGVSAEVGASGGSDDHRAAARERAALPSATTRSPRAVPVVRSRGVVIRRRVADPSTGLLLLTGQNQVVPFETQNTTVEIGAEVIVDISVGRMGPKARVISVLRPPDDSDIVTARVTRATSSASPYGFLLEEGGDERTLIYFAEASRIAPSVGERVRARVAPAFDRKRNEIGVQAIILALLDAGSARTSAD